MGQFFFARIGRPWSLLRAFLHTVMVVGALGWAAAALATPLPAVAPYELRLVTSDGVGTHIATPGVPMFGLNHDGVADLIITVPGGGAYRGTGTLLPDGKSLLIAAHLVSPTGVYVPGTSFTATWSLSGGPVSASTTTATVHPSFNPANVTEGYDVAILTFASAINPLVPRSDIYRGTGDVGVGVQSIKAGYGRSGHGSTGATTVSGTKRVGLNSYDIDARTLLSTLGGGSNPFGGSLPPAGSTSAYDFDDGVTPDLNTDALGLILGAPFAHTGFGIDEVNSAGGDSGGPTFLAANDTALALSSGASLGTFLVNAVPTQSLTVTRTGNNGTIYAVLYSGDATNSNATGTFSPVLADHKIAGITSYGFGFTASPPDVTPGVTDSSWGEVSVDMRVAFYQPFIDANVTFPAVNVDTQSQSLSLADSTAGAKSATLTIDNLATTSEVAGTGSTDPNNAATFTAIVLDHAEASFNVAADQDALLIDFGSVWQGSAVPDIPFGLFNLVGTPSFTAGLDLDSIFGTGDTAVLTVDLATFINLPAGSSNGYLASLDTTNPGAFFATYTLAVSDQNLLGALPGTSLVLTLQGHVGVIPEPGTLLLLAGGLLALRRRRRR